MPKPDYNRHVLAVFRRFIGLPVTIARGIWNLVSGWGSTPGSRRAKDSIRQSRVRRELRGLAPDHDPAAYRR
jgi:hypothetical protein